MRVPVTPAQAQLLAAVQSRLLAAQAERDAMLNVLAIGHLQPGTQYTLARIEADALVLELIDGGANAA